MDHHISTAPWRQDIARRRSAQVAVARIGAPYSFGCLSSWHPVVEGSTALELGWLRDLGQWLSRAPGKALRHARNVGRG